MSNQALTWAFGTDLPPSSKFVLVVLADYADDEHSCYPGQDKIAQRTGAGVRTVRRALADLEGAGYIRRVHRYKSSGYRTSDRYELAVTQISGHFGR